MSHQGKYATEQTQGRNKGRNKGHFGLPIVKIALAAAAPYPAPMPNDILSRDDSERLLVLLAYGLFLIAPAGGLTALIGVVIAHVRLAHALGSIHESHYRNQIRVFWTMLISALVMMTLFTMGMGFSFFTMLWPFTPTWSSPYAWPFWPGAMVGAGWAMALPLGALLSLLLVVWYYWRLLRGFVRALDDKAY
jgi:uncharacterized membrane protein